MKTFEVAKPNKFMDSSLFFAETQCSLFVVDGKLFISGCDSQEEAEQLLANHNPPTPDHLK